MYEALSFRFNFCLKNFILVVDSFKPRNYVIGHARAEATDSGYIANRDIKYSIVSCVFESFRNKKISSSEFCSLFSITKNGLVFFQ